MEIGNLTAKPNLGFGSSGQTQTQEKPLNAFGIGAANQQEVQLSPQARILQQNEQVQGQRQEALGQSAPRQSESEQNEAQLDTDYVRVSSSVGSAASNNLSNEKATEIYRSIQDLL